METLETAQTYFRANDIDGNKVKDYWRGDVAGLYALEVDDGAIKLIDLSVAGADDRPTAEIEKLIQVGPKMGYWYRALRFADEKEPDPDRWAVCAFPDAYGKSGTSTYIISHEGEVYKKDLGHGDGLEVYPADTVTGHWTLMN